MSHYLKSLYNFDKNCFKLRISWAKLRPDFLKRWRKVRQVCILKNSKRNSSFRSLTKAHWNLFFQSGFQDLMAYLWQDRYWYYFFLFFYCCSGIQAWVHSFRNPWILITGRKLYQMLTGLIRWQKYLSNKTNMFLYKYPLLC